MRCVPPKKAVIVSGAACLDMWAFVSGRGDVKLLLKLLLWSSFLTILGKACCPEDGVLGYTDLVCVGVDRNDSLHCEAGKYLLNPEVDDNDKFRVEPDGHLTVGNGDYTIDAGSYCIVTAVRNYSAYTTGEESPKEIVIACFPEAEEVKRELVLTVYGVCLCISTAFLLITFIVYCVLPELRDLQGKCLMCSVLSLAVAYVALAILQFNGSHFDPTTCVAKAFFLYFWMLCAFFWLNVVCFNVWKTVIFQRTKFPVNDSRLWWIYLGYGWGCPLLLLLIALATHHSPGSHVRPNFGVSKCWFQGRVETWAYFYGLVALLLLCNLIYFILTVCRLYKDTKDSPQMNIRSLRFKCMMYLKLFFVMGITWIFEVISYSVEDDSSFWYVTDVVNCLQGVLIFVIVVCRKRVVRALARRRLGIPCPRRWTSGIDEESDEERLAEEIQLSQTRQ